MFLNNIKTKECFFVPFGAINDSVIPIIKKKQGALFILADLIKNPYYFVLIPNLAFSLLKSQMLH